MSGASKMNSAEIGQIIRNRIAELHAIAPDSIGDRMHFSLIRCDAERGVYDLRCETAPWMRNGPGTLHGGMCATVVDQAMGFIAYCIKPGEGIAPTIQMSVNYHRPLMPGQAVLIRVNVISQTKSLMNLSAEAYAEEAPERLCLTASATYFFKPKKTSKNF